MTNKRVHYDVIKAWADGAEVQWKRKTESVWYDCDEDDPPLWKSSLDYRVKPQPKPDNIIYCEAQIDTDNAYFYYRSNVQHSTHNLKLTFDGESGKLKSAEVLK